MWRATVFALTVCLTLAPATLAQEPVDSPAAEAEQQADGAPETAQDGEVPDIDEIPEADGNRSERRSASDDPESAPEPESEPESESAPAQVDRLTCDDFDTQEEAQDYFTDEGGDDRNNVDGLDADGDGVACEALSAPTGGVDAGGGGTAPRRGDVSSPLPFLVLGGALGLAIGALSLTGRRRRARG